MEWIVHYGMPKTGTTTLQGALAAARRQLLERSILYPGVGPKGVHHIVNVLFKAPERLHDRSMEHRFGNDRVRLAAAARRTWQGVLRQIERHQPERVVLSSEFFLFWARPEEQARFRDLLGEVSDTVQLCLYVRSPASHYLSGLNQVAKSASMVEPPHPLRVRSDIEAVEAGFGQRMQLRAFERAQLRGGDIVQDFITEVLGEPTLAAAIAAPRRNETVSAEAMAILLGNRRANHAGLDWISTPDQEFLRRTLAEIEAAAGRDAKPQLRPGIAAAITRASTELVWLRDRYGVSFGDVDYAAIDGGTLGSLERLREIEEICLVDVAWRDELLYRALGRLLESGMALERLERLMPARRIATAEPHLTRVLRRLGRRMQAVPVLDPRLWLRH